MLYNTTIVSTNKFIGFESSGLFSWELAFVCIRKATVSIG